MFKFGVIGTGRIARKFCRTFASGLVPGGEVVAIASKDSGRGKAFAESEGLKNAKIYDYETILNDADIDAVYVASLNDEHFDCCKSALKKGKAVLCEKPLVTNGRDARELADLSRESGVFLMEALWSRFLPAVNKAGEWAAAGRIGKVHGMTGSLCSQRTPVEYPRLFSPNGGGALLDLTVYALHVAKHYDKMINGGAAYQQKIETINCITIPTEPGGGNQAPDMADFITLKFASGFVAQFTTGFGFFSPYNAGVIFGEGGYVRTNPRFAVADRAEIFTGVGEFGAGSAEKPDEVFEHKTSSGFEFEILHTMDCVKKGLYESPVVTHADSIDVIEIIEKLLKETKD